MAKRAPVDEAPYRPLLDLSVISAALAKPGATIVPSRPESERASAVKVIEAPKAAAMPTQVPKPVEVAQAERARPTAIGEGRFPATPELPQKYELEKRMLLTRSEAASLDRLVISLAGRLGAQVKLSHVLRALVGLLLNAEAELDQRAGEGAAPIRPPNGDPKALQRFERDIARILAAAIRDAGPLRD